MSRKKTSQKNQSPEQPEKRLYVFRIDPNRRIKTLTRQLEETKYRQQAFARHACTVVANLCAQLGKLLINQGKPSAAVFHLENGLKSKPNDSRLLRYLANAYVNMKQFDKAEPLYRALAEQNPTDGKRQRRLAGALCGMGRRAEGQYLMRRFFFDHPFRSKILPDSRFPPILIVYGFDQTHCEIKSRAAGHPKAKHVGGHFSLKELLAPPKRFSSHRWTIAEDNINKSGGVPDHALIVNTIADADIESRSLQSLAEFVEKNPATPVINDPQKVLKTTRDGNYRNLADIDGVTFPRTFMFSTLSMLPNEAVAFVENTGIAYPLIMRETGTHTARTVSLVGNRKELHDYFKTSPGGSFYVIEYIDERHKGEFFVKKRFFCIAGQFYPVVSHTDAVWNVHGGNRRTVMRGNSWMMDEERKFLKDPKGIIGEDNYAALEKVAKVIGLDFFGIDFTLRKNGGVLIFETNAAMRHSFDHAKNFPYLKPYMATISTAFARMIEEKLRLNGRLA